MSPNLSPCGICTCYVIDDNVYNKKFAYLFLVKGSVLVEFKTLKRQIYQCPFHEVIEGSSSTLFLTSTFRWR
jgi:hypothetical protein